MRCIPLLRRAGWLGAFSIMFLTPGAVSADEPPAAASEAVEAARQAAETAAAAAREAAREAAQQATEVAEEVAEEAQEAAAEAVDAAKRVVEHIEKRRIFTDLRSNYQLGTHIAQVPSSLDSQLELKGEGVLVDRVVPDGPAAKAGIKAYDVILNLGDQPVNGAGDVFKVVAASDGKELEIKLLRAGKPMTVKVVPNKVTVPVTSIQFPTEEVEIAIKALEENIREKLKDAGVDVRMQLIQPGKVLPPGATFLFHKAPEFPDDLTIEIRKHGKEPAEIEVAKGEQKWSVKEEDLKSLPDDVREHVEHLLGRGAMRFAIAGPGGKKFNVPLPPHIEDLSREQTASKAKVAAETARDRAVEMRSRVQERLERRLDEMSREMKEMRERMEDLRRSLRDPGERDGDHRGDKSESKDES